MTIHAERSAFALAIVLMGTGVLSADTISTTNVEFNITTPTVFNGVTNVYTYGTGSGTISANMTLENHAYVRLTGSMSDRSPTMLLIAPDENDVMIDISGQSAFLTTYRNSATPPAWTATGVAPNNTSSANSFMECRIGTRDGAVDTTGTAQIRVADALNDTFGNLTFGALWMEWLTVESSVSAGPSGTIDFLKLDDNCTADIGTIFLRNTHHPARILFNGGRYFSNNASRRKTYSLYPVAGSTLILESVNGAVINLHKQFGLSYLSGGTGGTVIFRGNCNVRLGSSGNHLKTPTDANFFPWYLGACGGYEDTIVWEHTGDLRLEGNCWVQCNRNDKLPYGPGTGGIYISGDSATTYSFLDLNGTTQRVNSITSQIVSGKLYGCVSNCDTTATSLLRFGTCNDDGVLQARCCAHVAATKEGTGLLRIRGTTLEDFTALSGSILVGDSAFSNITVAAGVQALGEMGVIGTLAFMGESAAYDFSKVTVALGAEGHIAVPSDATVTVLALTRDGTGIPTGTYAADGTDWLDSGTVRVLLTSGVVATDVTWTGGGATESAALSANWSAAANLEDGSARPVFATAGSRAVFEAGQYAFGGLTFSAPGDFTLADGGGASAQLFGSIAIADGDGTARRYEVEFPLTLHTALALAVPTNKTLVLSGGLDGYDSCTIDFRGQKVSSMANDWKGGTLVLSNATYSGALTHNKGGKLIIHGQLGQPGDTQQLDLRNGDYKDNSTAASGWAELGDTVLDNAVVYKPTVIGSRGQVSVASNTKFWFRTTPGSTNIFKNTFKQSASMYMALETNSTVIFEKGYDEVKSAGSGSVNIGTMGADRKGCTYIFKGPFVNLTKDKQIWPGVGSDCFGGLTFVLATNGNKCVNYNVGASTIDFRCDYSLSVANYICMNQSYGVLNLNGTKQRTPLIFSNAKYVNAVTGTVDSVLEITQGVANESAAASTNFSAIVKGAASLAMTGSGYFRMRAATHTSTGTLSVSAGTLALDAGCVWNGAQVVASGTGTLKIGSGGTFGENTVFAAEGDAWTFHIPSGVSQRVSMFLLDGKPQKSGTWGAIGSGAKYESARFTGGGFLAVRRLGTSLTLR